MKKIILIKNAVEELSKIYPVSEYILRTYLKKTGYGYEVTGSKRSWYAFDEENMIRARFFVRQLKQGFKMDIAIQKTRLKFFLYGDSK